MTSPEEAQNLIECKQAIADVAPYVLPWLLTGLYLLPIVLAARRNHRNLSGIALLSLTLGWTVVGWVAAMCWAMYIDRPLLGEAPPKLPAPKPPPVLPPRAPKYGKPKPEPLGSVPESWQN